MFLMFLYTYSLLCCHSLACFCHYSTFFCPWHLRAILNQWLKVCSQPSFSTSKPSPVLITQSPVLWSMDVVCVCVYFCNICVFGADRGCGQGGAKWWGHALSCVAIRYACVDVCVCFSECACIAQYVLWQPRGLSSSGAVCYKSLATKLHLSVAFPENSLQIMCYSSSSIGAP